MTFIGTDEQLVNCLRLAANTRNCPNVHAGAMIEAAARIEALTAERDAAVAQMQAMTDTANDTWSMGAAEGERRATAAIVAWLRALPSYRVNRSVVAELERNDHLNPLDT